MACLAIRSSWRPQRWQMVDVCDALTTWRSYNRAFLSTEAPQTMQEQVAKESLLPIVRFIGGFDRRVTAGTRPGEKTFEFLSQ
jgi:hypothetical protein